MSQPSPPVRQQPGPLGALLIGLTCLASGAALAAGRQLLVALAPPLTAVSSTAELQRSRHWSVDPERRRDAALLLAGRAGQDPLQQLRLLRGQGWGQGPLAAVTLKQAALAAEAAGEPGRAEVLWSQLLLRFPQHPASADALYSLGRSNPGLRPQLLQRFPAHPAALAAALEARDGLHLARWGPRWPGADALLRQTCRGADRTRSLQQRQQLSLALAQLGDGRAALRCLDGAPATAALQLSLARALLRGDAGEQRQAEERLLTLARRHPNSAEAREGTQLLAQQPDAGALAALAQLPAPLRDTAAVQARLALEGRADWRTVLRRWPHEPSSWDLQWELARKALLQRQWPQAMTLLSGLDSRQLPAPLAARLLFWQGYGAQALGDQARADALWRRLLRVSPGGYYAWRARLRLGDERATDPRRDAGQSAAIPGPELTWHPLGSADARLNELWRLGLALEAWEQWRHQRAGRVAQSETDLLLEGRLRTGVGDDWTGLGQLEQAGLRLKQTSCNLQWQRELQQHPRRFQAAFQAAARAHRLDPALLLAVARQESRFTAAVSSAVGAVGLLQLMPETAAELAGAPTSTTELQQPERNAALGARYLRQLLDQWQGDPFLAVASYNAGPGAVQGWLGQGQPDPRREPELWTEAIPYPETRLYTKKVLGNLHTYQQWDRPPC